MTAPSPSPADTNEFWGRAQERLTEASRLLARVRRISTARLAVVVVALALALGAGDVGFWSPWWVVVPCALFVWLAFLHEGLLNRARGVHDIAQLHHRAAIRVDRDTEGEAGSPGTPAAAIRRGGTPAHRNTVDDDHRLADRRHRVSDLGESHLGDHLDLFGSGGLFERLADWRTDTGGATLAGWLLQPAPPEAVAGRQLAIRELGARIEIHETLAATGALEPWPSTRSSVVLDWLASDGGSGDGNGRAASRKEDTSAAPWGRQPEALLGVLAVLLSAAMLGGLLRWVTAGEASFFLAAASLSAAWGLWLRSQVREQETVLRLMESEIAGIRQIALSVTSEGFESPLLRGLRERLERAEVALGRLERLQVRLAARRNLLFAPVAAMLFWGTHHRWAIERWRRRHQREARGWVQAAGEFDALLALAQYCIERPGHVFPEFDDVPGLEARGLGHPLIPEARLQRNDVRLGRGEADMLIVTGSNMSGKSTLLRTIGVNVVLARMGAPTAATTFRLGPLALGASIAVHDSLQDGVSRFLAELLALKAVLNTGSKEEPLLFLLDEVLQGTNSDDRRAAVAALLRELGRRSAVGVMTTHDLSLTELAHELPGRVRNMHFTERVVDGAMEFDYQLREGVLARGNALDLMRILDLPAPRGERADFTSLPAPGPGREN
ncbi:MAG: hypothetical protein OXI65_02575 [Acidobacteriota bacterium]|nr:hypothetical protein [Acidobacteriota bacterium]